MERKKPPGTVEFIVGPDDSLNSIALKFNVTPNKLVQLNKLFSRSVYPGQVSICRSAKSIRRELSPNSEDESPATVKFIKMSCKYFTDGMGVVGGVLIVTPNNIMFDPHKSDPLVIENGCEEYGLICPMNEVVSVALYDDLSLTETKDVKTEGPEELLSCVGDKIIRKLSLQEDLGDCGTSGLGGQNPGRPANGGKAGEERLKKNYESEMKSWLLKRMQAPIEDMLLSSKEKSKNPPMFLCFKVGKPMRKSFAISMTSSPAPWFRGQETQPEYWFAVPQERVHDLYSFFVQWSPDVYGKEAREQGFVVVEKDELDMIDNFFSDPSSCSWEIITINEAKRRQSFGSCDKDTSVDALPFLIDSSDVLQDFHIEKLASRLPARVEGYPWRLAYSTEKHGTSLKTLYRNLAYVDNPVLLVIKNMDDQIFGAFSTHPFRVSEHFYGTGETFLFSFCPELEVYRWTGENSYFVKGNTDSLQMGGGGGHLGLWLDGELYRGTTTKCSTFDNKPLSLQPDFNIRSLEVWTFE
uniref:Nuclear receptor coactivator 7 n=1 Tax=Nothobranchius furzeri TaxID=105023 RepID=A0A8C6KMF8_NOTFU